MTKKIVDKLGLAGVVIMLVVVVTTVPVFAVAFCISEWQAGDPPTCGLSVSVSASPSSITAGNSSTVTATFIGTFQTYNRLDPVAVTVVNMNNGSSNSYYFNFGPYGSPIVGSANTGPLFDTTMIQVCSGDVQGSYACNNTVINVTGVPPTATIHFSFLEKINNFLLKIL